MTDAYLLHIHGRVQGVGFRYFVKKTADKLGMVGYVKNRFDGTVEILCIGLKCDEFIVNIQKGNGYSRIDRIEKAPVNNISNFHYFEIRY